MVILRVAVIIPECSYWTRGADEALQIAMEKDMVPPVKERPVSITQAMERHGIRQIEGSTGPSSFLWNEPAVPA